MKRILSLVLCVGMLFTFCLAHAELEVPEPRPSQEALQSGFMSNLMELLQSLDLQENALRLEASQGDQALLDALLQRFDGGIDLNGTVAGMPIDAQLTGDAVLVSVGGQVFRLPYESLRAMSSGISTPSGSAGIDPMLLYGLFTDFFDSAILPSLSVASDENGQRFVFDLTQERLSESLIALGDAVAESDQLLQMLEAFGVSDFAGLWPQLRDMLDQGLLQASLHAEGALEGDAARLDADGVFMGVPLKLNAALNGENADFSFSAGDFIALNGSADAVDGGYEFHMTGQDDFAYDIAFTPADDGWQYGLCLAQGGATIMRLDAAMTEAALDADFSCLVDGADAPVTGMLHFDRATAALAGKLSCPEALGGMVADIAGEGTDTGYHVAIALSQAGEALGTADIRFTNTDELFGIEASATAAGDEPVALMNISFAFAKLTGAWTLRIDDVSDDYMDGEGLLTEERQTCSLEIGRGDRVQTRLALDIRNDDDVYSYHYTIWEGSYYGGDLNRVFGVDFDLDKQTGAFYGAWDNGYASTKYDFHGVIADGLLNLYCDAAEYGRRAGMFEAAAHWDDERVTAEFTVSDGYDTYNGSLIWSEALKSLRLNGDRLGFYAMLEQDPYGVPRVLRISASNGWGYGTELAIDGQKVLLAVNGTTTELTGHFKDENTYCLEVVTSQRVYTQNSVDIDFTVKDGRLDIVATNGDGEKLFGARLTPVEGTDVERLEDKENVIEITPEFIASMMGAMSGGEPYEAPTDYAEEDAATDYAEEAASDYAEEAEEAVPAA